MTGNEEAQSQFLEELGESRNSDYFIELNSTNIDKKAFFIDFIDLYNSEDTEDFDKEDIQRAIKYMKARKLLEKANNSQAQQILQKFDYKIDQIVSDVDTFVK